MVQELWVEKYKPQTLEGFLGNRKVVEEARAFVRNFKKGKALLLHGPPGVGKTLLPGFIAEEEGFHLVELNASDERGKKAIESYFSASKTQTLFFRGRIILIDEVDGLSAGDRGGGKAIVQLIKNSLFPVILVANDPYVPKLRSIRGYCKLVKFTKIPSPSIGKFLREVCKKENISVKGNVLKNIARFSEGDLRAALTDLQFASFGRTSLEDKDLEAIDYRERKSSVFNTLPTLFRSGSIATSRKLLFEGDKDTDEILWWMESNAHLEFPKESLPKVFELLAKADLFRSLVVKQQNWAFKGYMVDMLAGVSLLGEKSHRFVPYKPPDRFLQLARTKQKRALVDELCTRLGGELHCSKKTVRRDVLPYLKILLEKGNNVGLEEEDVDIIMA